MKIYQNKFAVINHTFPMRFVSRDGYFQDELNEDCIFGNAESANKFREECDEPEEYCVIRVVVIYEF